MYFVKTNKHTINTLFIALVFLMFEQATPNWEITTVDEDVRSSETSITIDSESNPHISYSHNAGLKYAYLNGTYWETELLESYCYHSSIVLDSNDLPHLSYIRASRLKYATKTISGWVMEDIAIGQHPSSTSISISDDGTPGIAFASYDDYLGYAYKSSLSWVIEEVDNGEFGPASLAIDSEGNRHISYYDNSDYTINYAYWDGSIWSTEIVEILNENNYFNQTSIDIDSENNPHIAYSEFQWEILKYAFKTDTEWQIETVDSNSSSPLEITIDSNDNPNISYSPYGGSGIRYARLTDIGWEVYRPNTNGGYYKAIAMDERNIPHISYTAGDKLNYAKWLGPWQFDLLSPPDGSEIGNSVTLDWEDAESAYGAVKYDVQYTTDEYFDTYDEITDISESSYTFPDGVLSRGKTYFWQIRAWDIAGEIWAPYRDYPWYFVIPIRHSDLDDGQPDIPRDFLLSCAYPNPSSGTATIAFALPYFSNISLDIFDVNGRKVTTLAKGEYPAGEYETEVNGLTSGIYLYRLKTEDFTDTKKMAVK